MKKIFLLVFALIMMSCNDVKIIESKDNFACRMELTGFGNNNFSPESDGIDGGNRFGDIEHSKYREQKLKKYPITERQNLKNLEKTKTLILKNFSETKVYKVTVQKKFDDTKVEYEDFELEPLKSVCIGCSKKYFVKLSHGGKLKRQINIIKPHIAEYSYLKYEGEVMKSEDVSYKIHRTDVLKTY